MRFLCRAPGGSELQLMGTGALEAAMHCAALTAAERAAGTVRRQASEPLVGGAALEAGEGEHVRPTRSAPNPLRVVADTGSGVGHGSSGGSSSVTSVDGIVDAIEQPAMQRVVERASVSGGCVSSTVRRLMRWLTAERWPISRSLAVGGTPPAQN